MQNVLTWLWAVRHSTRTGWLMRTHPQSPAKTSGSRSCSILIMAANILKVTGP